MSIYMWIASLAWLLLVSGYLLRRQRRWHVPLVVSAISLDFGLVLFLQLTRDAAQTAMGMGMELSPLEYVHILASTGAILCYLPTIYFGRKLLRGELEYRSRHQRVAMLALFLRTVGFLFMFSMWERSARQNIELSQQLFKPKTLIELNRYEDFDL